MEAATAGIDDADDDASAFALRNKAVVMGVAPAPERPKTNERPRLKRDNITAKAMRKVILSVVYLFCCARIVFCYNWTS